MADNPYDILGVDESASMDEVKKAYRKKARENHPDLNPNDPAAAERMNKINEAYDRIMNPEKYARQDARSQSAGAPYASGHGPAGGTGAGYAGGGYAGGGYAGGGQSPYDWVEVDFNDIFGNGWSQAQSAIHPEVAASDSAEVRQAVSYINAQNWAAALGILNNIISKERNARWHYLSAIANHGAGNVVAALDHIRRAQRLDPGNRDYAQAERAFSQRGTAYEQQSTQQGFSVGFIDPTTLCCCMLCFGPTFCQPLLLCL